MEPPPVESKDSDLIEQTLAGNEEAFGLLIQKHKPHLYKLCLRMLANHEDAEDVLQQVCIQAYRHLAGSAGTQPERRLEPANSRRAG